MIVVYSLSSFFHYDYHPMYPYYTIVTSNITWYFPRQKHMNHALWPERDGEETGWQLCQLVPEVRCWGN
jgi:hypothetical protein